MQAIWAKNLLHEKNIAITFQYCLVPEENTTLTLAASNLYRLFVNGKLIGYGPAKAAHGYSRLDHYSLNEWMGKETVLSVEVHSANINNFYVVDELPFFAAEIKNGEVVLASAPDFKAYHMTERVQKVRRFSFQRAFTEIYRMKMNPALFYAGDATGRTNVETETVGMNQLLPRYVSYPKLNKLPGYAVECGSVGLNPDVKPWRDRSYRGIDPVKLKGFLPEELEEDSGEEAGHFTYTAIKQPEMDLIGPMAYQNYDFERTLTGFFDLHVSAKTDTIMYIVFDELVTDTDTCRYINPFRNTCCNVLKYTLAAGEYDLLSFEANSARYAAVVITEGTAEVSDFGMVLYENPDAGEFQYDYGDERLNKIVEASINTADTAVRPKSALSPSAAQAYPDGIHTVTIRISTQIQLIILLFLLLCFTFMHL